MASSSAMGPTAMPEPSFNLWPDQCPRRFEVSHFKVWANGPNDGTHDGPHDGTYDGNVDASGAALSWADDPRCSNLMESHR